MITWNACTGHMSSDAPGVLGNPLVHQFQEIQSVKDLWSGIVCMVLMIVSWNFQIHQANGKSENLGLNSLCC